jgi:hypothetical protein
MRQSCLNDLYYYCETCKNNHAAGLKIQIDAGPPKKISIGAFNADKIFLQEYQSFLIRNRFAQNQVKL